MGIVSTALEFGGSAFSGGLLGFVGSLAGRAFGWLETRERNVQERNRWQHELQLQELQMRSRAEETEQEIAVEAQRGSFRGLEASVRAEGRIDGPDWLNAVRGLTRPVLTVLLMVMSTIIFFSVPEDGATVEQLQLFFIQEIVFLTSTAVAWWFGDRGTRHSARVSFGAN